MKVLKFFAMMFCFATLGLILHSCSKEDTSNNSGTSDTGSLIGTKWATHFASKLAIIEFTSDYSCEIYFADLDYDRIQSWGTGAYRYSDVTVSFFVSLSDYSGNSYRIDDATISGSTMRSNGSVKSFSSDSWTNWDKTWNKI